MQAACAPHLWKRCMVPSFLLARRAAGASYTGWGKNEAKLIWAKLYLVQYYIYTENTILRLLIQHYSAGSEVYPTAKLQCQQEHQSVSCRTRAAPRPTKSSLAPKRGFYIQFQIAHWFANGSYNSSIEQARYHKLCCCDVQKCHPSLQRCVLHVRSSTLFVEYARPILVGLEASTAKTHRSSKRLCQM